MISQQIYFNTVGAYFPEKTMDVEEAVALGKYEKEEHEKTQYKNILVEGKKFPAEMALIAAEEAMAYLNPLHVVNIFYTSIHRHGHKNLWSPASFLQRKLLAENAIPLCLNQGCNAQMLAIDMSIKVLQAHKKESIILLVASDQFNQSEFNRWKSDYGILYGDAATAITLSNKSGFAKIKKSISVSSPELEELHRFDQETISVSDSQYHHYDIRECKKRFMTNYGPHLLPELTKNAMIEVFDNMFNEDINQSNIKYFIFPNLGEKILNDSYYPIFQEAKERSLWDFGRNVGHLGTSDCIAGLYHLKKNHLISNGDLIFMLGAGAGFSWTALLIEIC